MLILKKVEFKIRDRVGYLENFCQETQEFAKENRGVIFGIEKRDEKTLISVRWEDGSWDNYDPAQLMKIEE